MWGRRAGRRPKGDSREVGLDQLVAAGITIRRAIKSKPWPSKSAVLEHCAVWASVTSVATNATRVLGDSFVPYGISTSLSPATREALWVEPLNINGEVSFIGSYVLGMGFALGVDAARKWISEDARYADVLFPYPNGKELNGDPAHSTQRWVITFLDWPESEARKYPRAYEQVLRDVRPERALNNRESRRRRWWLFAEWAPGFYKALVGLDQCIAITRHTHTVMPVSVTTEQVFSDALCVITDGDPGVLAALSSAPHYWWAIDRGSTMKGDLRYTPTDVFETLSRFQPSFEQVRWRVRTAWTRLVMRVVEHRSLRRSRQVLRVAMACSPRARIFAWARLTSR